MKPALIISALCFLMSCAHNSTYHLEVAGRHEAFSAEPDGGSIGDFYTDMMGVPVTTIKGDDKAFKTSGYGFQIGLTEELKYIQTTMSYFNHKFEKLDYIFNIDGTDTPTLMTLTGSGLEASLAIKLWWFRPQLCYKWEKMTLKSATSSSESAFFFGYGLGLDIPLSEKITLYASWSQRTRTSYNEASEEKTTLILAGLRMQLFKIDKKENSEND